MYASLFLCLIFVHRISKRGVFNTADFYNYISCEVRLSMKKVVLCKCYLLLTLVLYMFILLLQY